MIWNFSEVSYDYSFFENQVLEFKFPGHPAPPLELLVRICNAVQNWLAADQANVAVVHCRTGKRRTCTGRSDAICASLCSGPAVSEELSL
eukprot:SAG22_NODE_6838_length_805_cov_2.118980_1_plen_90_part_10